TRAEKPWKREGPGSSSRAAYQIELLLDRLGVPAERAEVVDFVNLRNDAVHPRQAGGAASSGARILRTARLWIEEALLWQIGYEGQYGPRRPELPWCIEPRY